MADLHLEAELQRTLQQGAEIGVLRARLAIARWLLARNPSDYSSKEDLALHVLSMPIKEEENVV